MIVPKIDSPLGMGECTLVYTADEYACAWDAVETGGPCCCVEREEGVGDGWDPAACVSGCSPVGWGSVSMVVRGVS